MAKRLTDTDIWKKQRWFRKLSPVYKLAFCYIKDMCDHAGVWKIDCSDLIEDLGIDEFSLQHFISTINTDFDKITGDKSIKERLKLLDSNHLWITGFIQFQYQGKDHKVDQRANAVGSALKRLEGFGTLSEGLVQLPEGSNNPYLILSTPYERGKVKDKVKDKDSISLTKNEKNEKTDGFVNFKAQGENLFADRFARHTEAARRKNQSAADRAENTGSQD